MKRCNLFDKCRRLLLTAFPIICRTMIDGGSGRGGGGLSPGVKAAIIVPSVLLGVALCLIGGAFVQLAVARTPLTLSLTLRGSLASYCDCRPALA